MSLYPARIKSLREARGLSQHQMAAALGINVPSYYDLEAFDRELTTTLNVREAGKLAELLGVTLRELLAPEERDPDDATRVTINELTDRLRLAIDANGFDAVEDGVGWGGVRGFLTKPSLWDGPLLFLIDLCAYLQIDWFAALPDGPTSDGTPTS